MLRLVTNRLDLPAELIAEIMRLRWIIEMFFRMFKASFAMIVCMLILLHAGEKPNRAMVQMVWYYLIGLASLKELEAFIKTRKQPEPAQPRPDRHAGFVAARLR